MRLDEIDFGYSKYNNRNEDIKRLKFKVKTKRGSKSFGIFVKDPAITDPKGIQPGFICVSVEHGAGTICNSHINNEWRGTGLGQMLYDKAIKESKRRGLIELTSDSSLTPDAHKAWARLAKRYDVEEIKGRYVIYLGKKDEAV